jgi:chemotaxis protein MotB
MDNDSQKDINYSEEDLIPMITSMEDEAADEGEAWLMSYADMMTLIACFFILMTAFASFDTRTFSKVGKEVKKHFQGANAQVTEDYMTELISKLEAVTQNKDIIKIKSIDNGIEIKFNSSYLFNSADSSLKSDMQELLDVIVEVINDTKKPFLIEAHGHTDSRPLKSGRFKNNWELSAARAVSVIKRFELQKFDTKNLIALGYGPSRPEMKDKDKNGKYIKANLAENRRVILLVKEPSDQVILGLGNIYKSK